jgi:hypothetical protein
MPRAGFKPTIPETKWPQTYASDRTATGKVNNIGVISSEQFKKDDKSSAEIVFFWHITKFSLCWKMKLKEGSVEEGK